MHLFFESPYVNLWLWSSKFPRRIFCCHSLDVMWALTPFRKRNKNTSRRHRRRLKMLINRQRLPRSFARLGSKWKGCLKQQQHKSKDDKPGLSENPLSAQLSLWKCAKVFLCQQPLCGCGLPASYTPTRAGAIQPRTPAHEKFITAGSRSIPFL